MMRTLFIVMGVFLMAMDSFALAIDYAFGGTAMAKFFIIYANLDIPNLAPFVYIIPAIYGLMLVLIGRNIKSEPNLR